MSNIRSQILILIPAFNEAVRIARVIDGVRSAIPQADVLVVNDGSSDLTAELAVGAGAQVVSHSFNMGYGVSIQTGYKYALRHGYEYLVQLDGDGQHDPVSIVGLLEVLRCGDADFVLGSRFLDAESYAPSMVRQAGMRFFRSLVRVATGLPISDCTSGFQAFNRDVIRFFTRDIFPVDYPDADVLITLHRAGFRIREVPVRMHAADGKSMHSGIKPLYYVTKMLLSIAITLLRSRKLYKGDGRCQ